MAIVLFFAATAAAYAVEPTTAPATRPTLDRTQVDALIAQLAHPQFKTRSQAAAALGDASAESLPALVEAYRDQRSYELKLRLREAIERVFYRRQLEGKIGFLGIGPRPESSIFDPATKNAVDVMFIVRVLPGFPAEKAGLAMGDMILDFDGKSVAEMSAAFQPRNVQQVAGPGKGAVQRLQAGSDSRVDAFTAEVSRRDAGTTVPIRLLRAKPADETVDIVVADHPDRTLDGVTFVPTMVPNLSFKTSDLLGPPLRSGLYVAKIAPDSAATATKLKPGDVILGVSKDMNAGTPFADQLLAQLKTAGAGATVKLRVCTFQTLTIPVTLGGRPVDRMNPLDMEIAQGRFADWWHSQTGEASYRTNRTTFYARSGLAPASTLLP